mmetsp:Transcript_24868/g.85229  ORF Transcript_24868/g.85229 Transcript_24868/m.85229 type:complete len:359 (+) Transcript_24868:290-1366(+)
MLAGRKGVKALAAARVARVVRQKARGALLQALRDHDVLPEAMEVRLAEGLVQRVVEQSERPFVEDVASAARVEHAVLVAVLFEAPAQEESVAAVVLGPDLRRREVRLEVLRDDKEVVAAEDPIVKVVPVVLVDVAPVGPRLLPNVAVLLRTLVRHGHGQAVVLVRQDQGAVAPRQPRLRRRSRGSQVVLRVRIDDAHDRRRRGLRREVHQIQGLYVHRDFATHVRARRRRQRLRRGGEVRRADRQRVHARRRKPKRRCKRRCDPSSSSLNATICRITRPVTAACRPKSDSLSSSATGRPVAAARPAAAARAEAARLAPWAPRWPQPRGPTRRGLRPAPRRRRPAAPRRPRRAGARRRG